MNNIRSNKKKTLKLYFKSDFCRHHTYQQYYIVNCILERCVRSSKIKRMNYSLISYILWDWTMTWCGMNRNGKVLIIVRSWNHSLMNKKWKIWWRDGQGSLSFYSFDDWVRNVKFVMDLICMIPKLFGEYNVGICPTQGYLLFRLYFIYVYKNLRN